VLLFGIYALAEGFILLAMSFKSENAPDWLITLLQGIAWIGTGIITFAWPGMPSIALLVIIAAWEIVTGIFEINGAIRLWEEILGEWLIILSGILSLASAYFLLSNPAAGALALVWVIGIYAIVIGILLMGLGIKVHRIIPGDHVQF